MITMHQKSFKFGFKGPRDGAKTGRHVHECGFKLILCHIHILKWIKFNKLS